VIKVEDKTKKILVILGIIFFLYFFIFVSQKPFAGEIIKDRPIAKIICNMQLGCHSGAGAYSCDRESKNEKLKQYDWYKGCNSSTVGYDGSISIVLESCSCGGLL
jgi:hypothetical protein